MREAITLRASEPDNSIENEAILKSHPRSTGKKLIEVIYV